MVSRTRALVRLGVALGLGLFGLSACGDEPERPQVRVVTDACSDGIFCNGAEVCAVEGVSLRACTECAPGPDPCAPSEGCSELSETCIPPCEFPPDEDNDGVWSFRCGGDDCDDMDPNRNPGETEVCDALGVDEDCDVTTIGDADRDGDGFIDAACFNTDASGDVVRGGDCDDSVASVHPTQVEVCNGVDDDCDGDVDEDVRAPVFTDDDGDGWGVGAGINGCAPQVGFALLDGDCDDTNPEIHPGSIECVAGGQGIEYRLCAQDGSWESGICPEQRSCVPQPDGTGVCI